MMEAATPTDSLVARMGCLADETRLRLLRLLEHHELGVVELCDILQLPQSTVSRHLKVLSDGGWAHSRSSGTTHLYRMLLDEVDPSARQLWLLAREQTEGWATLKQDELRLQRRLRDKETDSQAFFAGAAGQWDKLRGQLYGQGFTRSAIAALLPADWTVADLGCGTGSVTAEIAPYVRQVIGVDNSAAMLKAARSRTAGLHNVDLRLGDLESLPLEAGSADAALLLLALTYVPDPSAVLSEVARVLKRGGRAVVVDLLPHDRDDFRRQMGQRVAGFEPRKLAGLMREAGMASPTVHTLPPEPQAKGPALFLAAGRKAAI
jgi:ubiquinone/menaquinone biosynthesis C-methylase UbiE